jgi:hypothetical protein
MLATFQPTEDADIDSLSSGDGKVQTSLDGGINSII